MSIARRVAGWRVTLGYYSDKQLEYATITIDQVVRMGLPQRAAVIAVETMMTESNILMAANGNNAESLRYPHDDVGWDHGSVNQYQQQVGGAPNSTANWGTTAELMVTQNAATKFLTRLQSFDWEAMSNWDAAQTVQGSFDPTGGNYRRNDARATELVAHLWPVPLIEDDDMALFAQATDGDKAQYLINVNGLHRLQNDTERTVVASILGIADKISVNKPKAQLEIYRSVASRPNAL